MFGFLPAPYAYGAIYSATKDSDPKLALSLVFYYVVFGTVLILIGMIIRYKEFRDKELLEIEFQQNYEKNKIVEEEEKVAAKKPEFKARNADNIKNIPEVDKDEVKVNVDFVVR